MKIIISPAKKMREDSDTFCADALPHFMEQAEELRDFIQSLSYEQCKALWKCSDEIASVNYERFSDMDLRGAKTPALYAYDGIQYQYMAANVFTEEELSYVKDHLRILSGLYGVLRPFDAVVPYRLEMQTKFEDAFTGSLYDYWGSMLADALAEETDCILNLASKEYSKAVQKYLPPEVRWVDCRFVEDVKGQYKEKATQAKMARGSMVRYLAEICAQSPEATKGFQRFGFQYSGELSSPDELVFVKGDH